MLGLDVNVGCAFTVNVTLLLFVHPFDPVPVIVYVVVIVGLAVTAADVVLFIPAAGLHE